MRADKLVKQLGERYGDRVKVRSEYHVQVESDKGPHDIWLNRHGEMKFKPAGYRNVLEGVHINVIFKKIDSTNKTHVESMKEMLNVAQFIGQCEKQAKKIGAGVFTDAGFKGGTARIAAVMIVDGEVSAKARTIQTTDIIQAEKMSILLAIEELNPGELTIYNDNKAACKYWQDEGYERVEWLSRQFTKAADKIGNMRS